MADVTAGFGSIDGRYHFAIRRLHSLFGIIPIGVFLCIHLSVNATILAGPDAFQYAVDQIHNLDRIGILKVVELLFIILPIAFHAILGVVIWLSGRPDVTTYRHADNIRYALQRWTGVVAIVFILLHLWHVHWIIPGGADFDAEQAASTLVTAMGSWWCGPAYAIGVICAVYHFANGIWTFLITWGVTIGTRSQQISGRICLVIGLALGLLGMSALVKIKTMDSTTVPPSAAMEHRPAGGETEPHG